MPAAVKHNLKVHPAWIRLRKGVQYLALGIFLVLFLISRYQNPWSDWIGWFMRLDPLLDLTSMIASRTFLWRSALGLAITIVLALVAGRFWCGWLCPLGTALDLFSFKKRYGGKLPEGLRSVKYGLLLILLAASFLGNLTLLLLDPLTILYRSLTASIYPGLNQIVTAVEKALYPFPVFQGFISWLESVIRPGLLPMMPQYFNQAVLFGLIFLSVILLNYLAPRFWCRYLCPLGGLLGMISKIAVFRRGVGETCRNCSVCSRRCPTGTISPEKGYISDPAECIFCLDCFKNCADSTIKIHSPLKPDVWNDYVLHRREVLIFTAAAVAGAAVLQSGINGAHPDKTLLRPPGVDEKQLLSTCLRCGVCVRACPTNVLQPAPVQMGMEGLWTPILVPELGYCEYNCRTCGQVCPVQAIPPLSLEEKKAAVIGKAFIDQNRCLAWSDRKGCIVCEEMCPLPEKAIKLTDVEVIDEDGSKRTLRLPHVERQRCIGCGICEFKCPVTGEAAIRVYAVNPILYLDG